MMNISDDAFIAECAFTKVVETSAGPAILIAGEVIRVSGPEGILGRSKRDYAKLIATALRRSSSDILRNQPVNEIPALLSGQQVQGVNLLDRFQQGYQLGLQEASKHGR